MRCALIQSCTNTNSANHVSTRWQFDRIHKGMVGFPVGFPSVVHISHCTCQVPRVEEPRVLLAQNPAWIEAVAGDWQVLKPQIYVQNANLFAERMGEIRLWTQREEIRSCFLQMFMVSLCFNDTLLWLLKITLAIIATPGCMVQDGAFDGRRVVGAWIFWIWQRDTMSKVPVAVFYTNSWVEFHEFHIDNQFLDFWGIRLWSMAWW